MRLALVAALVALALGACEPEEHEGIPEPLAPGASGWVELGPGVQTTGYATLELRGFPAVTEAAPGEDLRAIPTTPGLVRTASIPLDGLALPVDFLLGADGIGATSAPRYRIVAWLARTPGAAAPEPGAPWGTATIDLPDCSFACESTCHCGLAGDARVELTTTRN